jgi:hypothetical protein
VRPELEQPALALAAPGGAIEQSLWVIAEPREQRQVMRTRQHVHRIDLQEPQPLDAALHLAGIHCRRPRNTEARRRQRNAPRRCGRQFLAPRPHP